MQQQKFAFRPFAQRQETGPRPWSLDRWLCSPVGLLAIGAIAVLAPNVSAASLTDWHYDTTANELEVIVADGGKPNYFLMAQPARIVLDFPDTEMGAVKANKSYSGAIKQVRVSQFQPGVTRIVLELAPEVSLAPGQVKLEQVRGETGGDRWILRPLIVQSSSAAALPPPPSITEPELPPAPSVSAPATPPASTDSSSAIAEPLPPEVEPKRSPTPAIAVPQLEPDQSKPGAKAPLEQPVQPPLPPTGPQAETEPEPSPLVIPPEPAVTALPAIGSDFTAVTTEPPPGNILPPSAPPSVPPVVSVPPLPTLQTTPLPPLENAAPAVSIQRNQAAPVVVPPPMALPGERSPIVVPSTSTPSTAPVVPSTVIPVQPVTIAPVTIAPNATPNAPIEPLPRPASSVIVPTDRVTTPLQPIAPVSKPIEPLEIPSTVVEVVPSVPTAIQVPPPAAIADSAPTTAQPIQIPAPMPVPPLNSANVQSPSSRLQTPASSVFQPPTSSVLQTAPATTPMPSAVLPPLSLEAPSLEAPSLETPSRAVSSSSSSVPPASVLQAPASSVMQGNPALVPPATPTTDGMRSPVSSVMQSTTSSQNAEGAAIAPPTSSVMQSPNQSPGLLIADPPPASVLQPPSSSILQAPSLQAPSLQAPSLQAPSLQAPASSGLQLPSTSVVSPTDTTPAIAPSSNVLPPIATNNPAVVSVPPLQLPTASSSQTNAVAANSNAFPVPTVEFGQPLPTEGASTLNTVPRTLPNVAPSPSWGQMYYQAAQPGIILPAGATLRLAYPGTTALTIAPDRPQQDVLLLQTEVRDFGGTVVFPRGSYVTGQFEGGKFIARAIAVGDRTVPFDAESPPLNSGSASIDPASMALYSGAGALAGGLVSQFSAWGLILGGAAGAATNYLTAPRPTVVVPGQIIPVQTLRNIP